MRSRAARLKHLAACFAFIAPNAAIFLVFTLIPVIFTLGLAFFRWDPFTSPEFVGFDNFNRALASADFWYYLWNTLVFLLGLPLGMAGALFMAVLLSQKIRGVVAYRTIVYLPTVTSGVALLLLWKTMFAKDGGLINTLMLPVLQLFGVTVDGALITAQSMPSWLDDPATLFGIEFYMAKPALIVMGVWGAIGGGMMLLYLAALAGVPPELYEAAEIDGASRWQRFWHITWPMIAPTTFFIIVTGVIGGLQGGFEMAYLMTRGGPDGSTTTIGYHIFTKAFFDFEFGYAAALSVLLFLVIAAITVLNWRFGSKAGGY
jgi:multiple sugar transport system permease protein